LSRQSTRGLRHFAVGISDSALLARAESSSDLVLPGSAVTASHAGEGRPPSIDAAQVHQLKALGLGATEIAKTLGVGRASVYRVLEASQLLPGLPR
jgi:Helix-turn-helix domain of resolvase